MPLFHRHKLALCPNSSLLTQSHARVSGYVCRVSCVVCFSRPFLMRFFFYYRFRENRVASCVLLFRWRGAFLSVTSSLLLFCARARASVQVEAFKEQVDEAINKAQKMMDRGELR